MNKNSTGILAVLGITIAVLSIKFYKLVGYLNNYTFNNKGDGFQSYFNFSYYLRYDSGIRLDGVNYPYGEHLHFINSHPLYLYLIDLLGLRDLAALEGVGIINGMMLLSIVISVPFIYLILREFKLPQWYAIIIAVLIQFCYPHFDRINGHFEFALAFVIPAYWYFILRFERSSRPLYWAIGMMIYLIIICSISVYMAVFSAVLSLVLGIVKIVQYRRSLKRISQHSVPLIVISLLPLLLFLGFLEMTDIVTDRPTDPWGFYKFNANPLSIFLPDTSVIKSILPARMYDYSWEGRTYVGLPATFLALIMILYVIFTYVTTRRFDLSPFLTNEKLNVYLVAATLILLYAMCWPFKWGLHFIADNLPLVKQFRALGRFAWVFYYVFTVFTAYQIFHFYRRLRSEWNFKFAAFVLMTFVIFQWVFDAGINLGKTNFEKIQPNIHLGRDDSHYLNALKKGGIYTQ